MWGVKIAADSRKDVAAGTEYAIRPVNTSDVYRWSVRGGVVVKAR
jgi:hypothetical protein